MTLAGDPELTQTTQQEDSNPFAFGFAQGAFGGSILGAFGETLPFGAPN